MTWNSLTWFEDRGLHLSERSAFEEAETKSKLRQRDGHTLYLRWHNCDSA